MKRKGFIDLSWGWYGVALIVCLASYLLSEVSDEKYKETNESCVQNGSMHKECKEVMADKKMTNFEYMLFVNELYKKEQEAYQAKERDETLRFMQQEEEMRHSRSPEVIKQKAIASCQEKGFDGYAYNLQNQNAISCSNGKIKDGCVETSTGFMCGDVTFTTSKHADKTQD